MPTGAVAPYLHPLRLLPKRDEHYSRSTSPDNVFLLFASALRRAPSHVLTSRRS
jgi:hypothetical protein